jgi:acyl-lipid omega-6 desaturase (Delta-12 desaturase)
VFEATHEFAVESRARSWWCVASTYLALAASLTAAAVAPWWTARLAASLLGALLLVRAFVLFHDYMHGSILKRSNLARAIFYLHALLSLSPPRSWRASHNYHHANVGRLEAEDAGSFPLMSVAEWRRASPWRRFAYRAARHPLTVAASYLTVFLVNVCVAPMLRRPARHWDSGLSLALHGAALACLVVFGGFASAFFVMLLPMTLACALGAYLFFVQHNEPSLGLLPAHAWNRDDAALASSSYLRTGAVMGWFTGNIGYHHVHHVNHLIPSYALPRAMASIPELQDPVVTSLHPRDVIGSFRVNLWDEEAGRMVRYRDSRTAR